MQVCCSSVMLLVAAMAMAGGGAAAEPTPAHWLEPVDGHWVFDTHFWSTDPHYPDADNPEAGDRYFVYIDQPSDEPYTVTVWTSWNSGVFVAGLHVGGDARLLAERRINFDGPVTVDGEIEFDDALLAAHGDQTIGGAGQIILNDGRITSGSSSTVELLAGLTVRSGLSSRTAVINGADNHGLMLAEGLGEIALGLISRNFGTLQVRDAGSMSLGTVVNHGQILLQDDGLLLLSGSFRNEGAMYASGGMVHLPGEHRFADLGAFDFAQADVVLTGELDNENAVSQLDASTGSWMLHGQARIRGGTIRSVEGARWIIGAHELPPGPGISVRNAFFEDVVVDADVLVRPEMELRLNSDLHLTSGAELTLSEPHLSGAAELLSSVDEARITGSGTIVLDGSTTSTALRPRRHHTAQTLIIGPDITVRTGEGSGSLGGRLSPRSSSNSGHVINEGTVLATTPGSELYAGYGLVDAQQQFTNRGLMRVDNDSLLRLQGNWQNEGVIEHHGGTLMLAGAFTTDGLGQIVRTGGTLLLEGVWDNRGHTVVLDDMLGSVRFTGRLPTGTIRGGRIASSGEARLSSEPESEASFDGVELALPMYAGIDSRVTLAGDIYLDDVALLLGVGERERDTPWNVLRLDGGEIGGRGEIHFYPEPDDGPGSVAYNLMDVYGPTVLGADIHVRADHGMLVIDLRRDWLVNRGRISFDQPGRELSIRGGPISIGGQPGVFWREFHNEGVIKVGPGSTLHLWAGWANTGTIRTTDAHVILGGEFPGEALVNWERIGGTALLIGTADLGGGTLTLNEQTGSLLVDDTAQTRGSFVNGVLGFDQPGRLSVAAGGSIGFSNVTLEPSVTLTLGAGQTMVIDNPLTSAGVLELAGGRVEGGRLEVAEPGVLHGFGEVAGELRNRGELVVDQVAGGMTVGDIFQNIGEDAVVRILWGGSPGSGAGPALAIEADAYFDGVLRLELDGITPGVGDVFRLLSFENPAQVIGGIVLGGPTLFAALDLPELAGHRSWDVDDLYVTGTITVVPEPASLAAVAAVLPWLAGRRRRADGRYAC